MSTARSAASAAAHDELSTGSESVVSRLEGLPAMAVLPASRSPPPRCETRPDLPLRRLSPTV